MKLQKILATMIVALMVAPTLAAQTTRLKIATMVPDGSFWMKEFEAAADEIDRRTGGRVNLRFYPGGTMGSDTAVLRKMRIGQLHGGFFWQAVWLPSIRISISTVCRFFSDPTRKSTTSVDCWTKS